ncbi:MAG TPA: diacylglycerol kinase family protein [Saprospiraceae bacterium]|nr:diacylglycerol kinase family protein [Saprospiraceae bacterium]
MGIEPLWSVIINISTCSDKEWMKWQRFLEKNKVSFKAFKTASLDHLSGTLSSLLEEGNLHFLFAGGDGTLHQGGNLLIRLAGEKSKLITIGVLPSGTGNDWVRTFGIKTHNLAVSLKRGATSPLHLIRITWPDGKERYAFNMVGGALDAAVVNSLSNSKFNIPGKLKYPVALLNALMKPRRWNGKIVVDGFPYNGDWLTIQAGFGKYCGGGMYVLPHAEIESAALLLMKPKSLLRLLTSLPKLYNGKVAQQEEAIALHFSIIEINHSGVPIPIEADGEALGSSPVKLEVSTGFLKRLSAE